jgi:hypothetical protein
MVGRQEEISGADAQISKHHGDRPFGWFASIVCDSRIRGKFFRCTEIDSPTTECYDGKKLLTK